MNDTAVLLCGHGSRDPDAIREFEIAAAGLRRQLGDQDFATGYLEFARPTICRTASRPAANPPWSSAIATTATCS